MLSIGFSVPFFFGTYNGGKVGLINSARFVETGEYYINSRGLSKRASTI